MDAVKNLLKARNFAEPKHRYIFEAMKNLQKRNREIDYVSLVPL